MALTATRAGLAPECTDWILVNLADECREVSRRTLALVTKPPAVSVTSKERSAFRSRVVTKLGDLAAGPLLIRHTPDGAVFEECDVVSTRHDRHPDRVTDVRRSRRSMSCCSSLSTRFRVSSGDRHGNDSMDAKRVQNYGSGIRADSRPSGRF